MHIRKIGFVLLSLAAVSVFSSAASAQTDAVMIANIRAHRAPHSAFEWNDGGITSRSMPLGAPVFDLHQGTASFDTVIDLFSEEGSILLPDSAEPAPRLHLQTRITIPALCPSNVPLSYVTLSVEHVLDDGTHTAIDIPVEHRCIVGRSTLDSEALVAQQDPRNSAVQEMADAIRAAHPETPEALREAIINNLLRQGMVYVPDPLILGVNLSEPEAYALSPELTLRYGGDCEDISIIVVSILEALGVPADVDTTIHYSHAIVITRTSSFGEPFQIDATPFLLR